MEETRNPVAEQQSHIVLETATIDRKTDEKQPLQDAGNDAGGGHDQRGDKQAPETNGLDPGSLTIRFPLMATEVKNNASPMIKEDAAATRATDHDGDDHGMKQEPSGGETTAGNAIPSITMMTPQPASSTGGTDKEDEKPSAIDGAAAAATRFEPETPPTRHGAVNEDEDTTRKKHELAMTEEAPEAKKVRRTPELNPAMSSSGGGEGEGSGLEDENQQQSTGPRRSGRERKAVQRSEFVSGPEDGGDAEDPAGGSARRPSDDMTMEDIQVEQGRGVQLGSISTFVENYESMRSGSAAIRKLFKALYGISGRPQSRKEYLLAWSGLPEGIPDTKLASDLGRSCTVADLRDIGKKLLGIPTGANGRDMKQAWVDAIVSVLAEPQASVIHPAVSSDSKGGRTNMTGYQLFCADMRAHVVAENPAAGNKELMKLLGAKWRALDDQGKQKYQALSAQRRISGAGGAGSSPGRKRSSGGARRRRQQESSEEEQDVFEGEDDEEEEEDEELISQSAPTSTAQLNGTSEGAPIEA